METLAREKRFTRDGSEALEHRIAEDMRKVRESVLSVVDPRDLTALILGGGYGRGEGGVYVHHGEERPYNDYDFFVVVPDASRRKRKTLSRRLLGVKERLEPECGIHVDFGPPLPAPQLPRYPYELMFMEARAGHRVIYGPENVLLALPEYPASCPPLEEGARLFMNRGVGLMLTAMLLRKPAPLAPDEHEFAVRNIQKAVMAMGDGVLMAHCAYDTSCLTRRETLAYLDTSSVPESAALIPAYDRAVDFKLRPTHDLSEDVTLRQWHAETVALYAKVFLWFERHRLNRPEMAWREYSGLPARLPWEGARAAGVNAFRHWRAGTARLNHPWEWVLHPRDVILRELPEVLFSETVQPVLEQRIRVLWERYG